MSYDNSQQKPDPSLEKSVKYISSYMTFKMKDELKELMDPQTKALISIAESIDTIAHEMKGKSNG